MYVETLFMISFLGKHKSTFKSHSSSDPFDMHRFPAETVCNNVAIDAPLQLPSGQFLTPGSANQQDDASTDIYVHGFWGWRQSAF